MKKHYYILALLVFFTLLFFSCRKDNTKQAAKQVNATEINLAIGIRNDADLNIIFQTLNELNFDIRQMNGFFYNSSIAETGITDLINILNQKPYINTGAWKANPYTVYYFSPENCTRIVNSFFNMNRANQADLLNTINTLSLTDRLGETKDIYLSIPAGTENYWKQQLLTYPFIKWAETFDQTCLSYAHADVASADVPATGPVNQVIPITARFVAINGCGGFGSFSESQTGNTRTITVNAKYQGCVCTQDIQVLETTYNFSAVTTGEHTIRFLQPDGQFLSYPIIIQ